MNRIDIITKNTKKGLSFDQNKHKLNESLKEEKIFRFINNITLSLNFFLSPAAGFEY